jgi:peptidoglycan/xylan/chitin deacetylase (PgdA/CDA1 family)
VPATFFLIGYEAQAHPGLVRQEAKMGFAIGDHSWSHPLGFAGLDQSEMVNQISRTYDELKSLGVTPYLFRPPGGSFDGAVVEEARRLGMRTEIWTIDTHDYLLVGKPDTIVKEVLQQVHPGSIVLMHDGGGDRSATVKALPQIIKGLRKKGYTFTTIPKEGWLPGPIPQIQSSESPPPNGKPSKNEPNPAPSLAR